MSVFDAIAQGAVDTTVAGGNGIVDVVQAVGNGLVNIASQAAATDVGTIVVVLALVYIAKVVYDKQNKKK